MSGELVSLNSTLDILESFKNYNCNKHRINYFKCIEDKNLNFETCYILHMEKFINCKKSLEEIKKLKTKY